MTWHFPRIPHLQGSHATPDDLVLDPRAQERFLRDEVWVLEKMDGLNVAVEWRRGSVEFHLKADWAGVAGGAVERAIGIHLWQRRDRLAELLRGGRVLFGEWLWHRLSTRYDALADVFHGFALCEAGGGLVRADVAWARMRRAGLTAVEPLWRGRLSSVREVRALVGRSRHGRARMEGVVLEHVGPHEQRYAKWVEPSYAHVHPREVTGERNALRGPPVRL